MMIDYTLKYVQDVLDGKIVACQKIIKACKRHIKDLDKSKNPDYPYYFNIKEANKAIKFIELLPDPSSGKPIKLLPFQRWIIGSLYGWRFKDDDARRFNRLFYSVARKNGKTVIVSAIGAYELLMGKSPARNRQIIFTSNAMKQAKIGFNFLQDQINKVCQQSKFMRKRVRVLSNEVRELSTNSRAFAIASDSSTVDGFAPTISIIDEFHESKDLKMYNVLKSGMVQQKNGLLAIISTSGLDTRVPMFQEYKFLEKVLDGKVEAERYFVAIFEQDDEEEIHNVDLWEKSNPILAHKELRKTLIENLKDDVKSGIENENLNQVLVKNFNMWRQASSSSYISYQDWDKAYIDYIPNIKGRSTWIGLDMSKTDDLTSCSWCVQLEDGTWFVDSHSWVGTKYGLDTKIKRDGVDYRKLEQLGECDITKLESGIIDYEEVVDWIINFVEENQLDLQAICYDPYNANTIITKLEKHGYPMIEVRQTTPVLNVPTRQFRLDLYDGKIKHRNNTLLNTAINNAIVIEDNNGIRISKEKSSNKVDPLAALLDAYSQSFDAEVDTTDLNEFYHDINNISF